MWVLKLCGCATVSAAGGRVLVCMAEACCDVHSFLPSRDSTPRRMPVDLQCLRPPFITITVRGQKELHAQATWYKTHAQAHNTPRHQIRRHWPALGKGSLRISHRGKLVTKMLACWLVGCIYKLVAFQRFPSNFTNKIREKKNQIQFTVLWMTP